MTKYNQTYFVDKKNENKKSTMMIATPILLKKLCSFEGQARVLEKYLHEGTHTVYLIYLSSFGLRAFIVFGCVVFFKVVGKSWLCCPVAKTNNNWTALFHIIYFWSASLDLNKKKTKKNLQTIDPLRVAIVSSPPNAVFFFFLFLISAKCSNT